MTNVMTLLVDLVRSGVEIEIHQDPFGVIRFRGRMRRPGEPDQWCVECVDPSTFEGRGPDMETGRALAKISLKLLGLLPRSSDVGHLPPFDPSR